MVTCVNPKCENYKQELEDHLEVCPACNSKTEKIGHTVNNSMGMAAIILGVLALAVFWMGQYLWMIWAGIIMGLACIVFGFLSRSKPFLIISIILFLVTAGLFVNYFIIGTM